MIVKIEIVLLIFLYCYVACFNKNKKALQLDCQRAGISRLPRQNDFRNFCMREEAEKVYRKLEEVISV
jgi:hypothetical protein